MKNKFLPSFILLCCCFWTPLTLLGVQSKPNVLFLLADDLGYGDVGFNGCKDIQTPHIDKLAESGARLESFYVQPVCSPTRASLMTGRYPMRYGMQVGVIKPWERRGLSLQERMLPQVLRAAGYTTAICGKWHLGCYQRAYLPTARGFEHQYGHYSGALDYFTHVRDGGFDWHRDDQVCRDEGYTTHLDAREAQRILREQPAGRPFFLYVPFNAVHTPHQVPKKYCEPYAKLPEPRRTYAGMLAAMDEAIGQILATLDERGFRSNTLIFFSSDNGGPAPGRVTSNGPLRAGKGTVYEGGTRVCACVSWQGQIQPGTSIAQPLHMVDWYPTLVKLAGGSLEQPLALDGRDMLAVLTQGKASPHEEILLNTSPRAGAIRVGDWKLVVNGSVDTSDEEAQATAPVRKKRAAKKQQREGVELFHLAQDLSEQHDLSKAMPEKVKELRARYDVYAKAAAQPGNQPKPAGYVSPKVWGEQE